MIGGIRVVLGWMNQWVSRWMNRWLHPGQRRSAIGLLLGMTLTGLVILAPFLTPFLTLSATSQPNSTNRLDPSLPAQFRVATRDNLPPFAFTANGEMTGFSLELWRKIASKLGVPFTLQPYDTVDALLQAIAQDQADVGIAAISITSQREERFDFSHPIFDGSLQILVRSQNRAAPNLISVLFSPALLQLFGLMGLLLLIPAHIIWFTERKHPDSGVSPTYFPGIFEACWWAAATLATQADSMPKTAIARLIAIVWMFISVLFVAYFTATVTSSLTISQIQSNIQNVEDLHGKSVMTVNNSTSAKYLEKRNIQVQGVATIQQAYDALLKKQVEAVVFDAPVLLYFAAHEGKGQVELVGHPFRRESYGIVFPRESRLRKPINEVLLTLHEDGTYQQLYGKWFGQLE
jgi:polar amino acid transport system substrate-binding protein